MLNVLNINDCDLTNRRFNGYDLRPFLQPYGINSEMLVWRKQSDEDFVSTIGPKSLQKIHHLPFAWLLPLKKSFRDADILHFQLVHLCSFPLSSYPFITSTKPTVWTIHDFWSMTGGCLCPFECKLWKTGCSIEWNYDHESIDYFKSRLVNCENGGRTNREWSLKQKIFSDSSFEIIVSSPWMERMVRASPLLKGKTIHVVPFGINQKDFYPMDQALAKSSLGLDANRLVVSFRSSIRPEKNLPLIKKALLSLLSETKDRLQVIAFSEKGLVEILRGEFPVLDCGWVSDSTLNVILNASDIVLMPSKAETFGLVALEAMACGKPVIVGEGTALPDLAEDLVSLREPLHLADMLDKLLDNEKERHRIGQKNFDNINAHHTIEGQARQMAEIYQELV